MSRVLIVDEQGNCVLGLDEPLRALGFEVVSVGSYREGTRVLQKDGQPFDLIILNIEKTPRKGVEWLRQTGAVRLQLGLLADRVLCVASPFLDPHLELDIESAGGKVVYEQPVRSSAA